MAHQSDDKAKLRMPKENDNIAQAAAAPIATVASHADPWPHYLLTGACGASAVHACTRLNNPRMAAIKGTIGLAFLFAGCGIPHVDVPSLHIEAMHLLLPCACTCASLCVNILTPAPPRRSRQLEAGNTSMGYDVGTLASLALIAAAGPRAWVRKSARLHLEDGGLADRPVFTPAGQSLPMLNARPVRAISGYTGDIFSRTHSARWRECCIKLHQVC
jgi:hypothetical protein